MKSLIQMIQVLLVRGKIKAGFTLLEIAVVMLVIGILLRGFGSFFLTPRNQGAPFVRDLLLTRLQEARLYAINNSVRLKVAIDLEQNRVTFSEQQNSPFIAQIKRESSTFMPIIEISPVSIPDFVEIVEWIVNGSNEIDSQTNTAWFYISSQGVFQPITIAIRDEKGLLRISADEYSSGMREIIIQEEV